MDPVPFLAQGKADSSKDQSIVQQKSAVKTQAKTAVKAEAKTKAQTHAEKMASFTAMRKKMMSNWGTK